MSKVDLLYDKLVSDPGNRAFHYANGTGYKSTRKVQSGLSALKNQGLAIVYHGGYYPSSPKLCTKCKGSLFLFDKKKQEKGEIALLTCEQKCKVYAKLIR